MVILTEDIRYIKEKFDDISYSLDERRIRLWCATEAKAYNRIHGRGGVTAVHKATNISRPRIYLGLKEIENHKGRNQNRTRGVRGGRKKITEKYPDIFDRLESLVEPLSRGDPESPLRWTCKSTRHLRDELTALGYEISQSKVGQLLSELDYSLQSNRKTEEGGDHPDRNAQFEYINEVIQCFQRRGLPAVSVDTKKKENIGNYANKGKEYRKKGNPQKVKVYDFIDKSLGKAVPYGIYDLSRNEGFVNLGVSHDTAEFAVNSIRNWWYVMGKKAYRGVKEILITADCGGSNGCRVKLWKSELQKLADEIGMNINICHFPPGTSKWNKIEHRMFCRISQSWRGEPLTTREKVLNLIRNTRTRTGLMIKARLDKNKYKKGIEVTDEELNSIHIEKADFHGDWNYRIKPRRTN
jgi:hypothetical protein